MNFTKEQIRGGNVEIINRWHGDGGWVEATESFRDAVEVIESRGIYVMYVRINGEVRKFYSRGAKEYGIENLD